MLKHGNERCFRQLFLSGFFFFNPRMSPIHVPGKERGRGGGFTLAYTEGTDLTDAFANDHMPQIAEVLNCRFRLFPPTAPNEGAGGTSGQRLC